MNPFIIIIAIGCLFISALLLRNLWRGDDGSVLLKLIWSFIIMVPVFGWIFYGGFYSVPDKSGVRAKGGASGWYSLYK